MAAEATRRHETNSLVKIKKKKTAQQQKAVEKRKNLKDLVSKRKYRSGSLDKETLIENAIASAAAKAPEKRR